MSKIKWLGLFVMLLLGQTLLGQEKMNPFEIEHRLTATNKSKPSNEVVNSEAASSTNPFEVRRNGSSVSVQPERKVIEISPASDAPQPHHLMFTALIAIIPITFLFTLFREYFNLAYQNVISGSNLSQSLREYTSKAILPTNIWYIAAVLNLGIFLALALRNSGSSITQNLFYDVLLFIGFMGALVLLKHIVLHIIAYVFPVQKTIRQYNYLIILFGIVLGVALIPINIGLLYIPDRLVPILLWIGFGLVLASYLVRSLRGLIIGNTLFVSYGFHFLLYICAVEITPVLILVKIAFLFTGKS